MTKDYEFTDITPLIISFDHSKNWYHPYINDYYSPDSGDDYDNDVYRIYFENSKGKTLSVYFKSKYIDKKVKEWSDTGDYNSEDESKWPDKSTIFKKPFVDTDSVLTGIQVTLLDDVWGPTHPNGGFPRRTSPEWNKWLKESETNQFCFSKTGTNVNKFFRHKWKVSMFSLDCGLTTDGKTWWCDS